MWNTNLLTDRFDPIKKIHDADMTVYINVIRAYVQ